MATAALAPLLLFVLALFCWATSTSWLRYAKLKTDHRRDMAALFTGWTFAYVGVASILVLSTL